MAVELMAAHDRAVEQKHRNIEPETPEKLRIFIHIDDVYRGQYVLLRETCERRDHLIA